MPTAPVTIVTGAGSGIGRAVCELLAAAGHRLVLVGRTEQTLEETMRLIASASAAPPDVLLLAADVTDAAQARSVTAMAVEHWGRVDGLVNNAGTAVIAPIDETDEDRIFTTFAVNTFGPAYLISSVWPHFLRQRAGCVVNVSSMAAWDPFPGFFLYAAAKSAAESFVRSIMVEGREHGIRAFAVAPGAVETPLLRRLFSTDDLPPSATRSPHDVAHVICDCILGRRDAEVGTTIRLPGPGRE